MVYNKPAKVKRLFADIEVSPNVVLAWRTGYDLVINHESIIQERKVICIGLKWQGESRVRVLRWDKDQDDKEMLREFIKYANEADEIIWHHGDKFDGKWIKGRCLINKLPPLPIWKTVDTKKLASSTFLLNCNKLDYIGQVLGLGQKRPSGYALWKDIVLKKCPKALDKMCFYCAGDVELLESVYDEIQPHVKVKTHAGVLNGRETWTCPRDGSTNVRRDKIRVSAAGVKQHQMICLDCGGYYSISEASYKSYLAAKKKPNDR